MPKAATGPGGVRYAKTAIGRPPNLIQLAEPIVGARLPDFYPGYLEDAVEKSSLAIKAR